MRVLITAGTGMIGRALARELAEKGHHVTVTSRDPGHLRGHSRTRYSSSRGMPGPAIP